MADSWKGKDWTKVVLIDDINEYVFAKYRKNWKENDGLVDEIFEDL